MTETTDVTVAGAHALPRRPAAQGDDGPGSVAGTFPLTAYQRDIWIAESFVPGLPQFNCLVYDRYSGPVDVDALLSGLSRVVERNTAFALRFTERDGEPGQWVDPTPVEVDVVDFRSTPDPEAGCLAWLRASFDRPFDVWADRLVEVALLRVSDTVNYVYLKAHHVVGDGWSMGRFLADVRAAYAALRETGRHLVDNTPSYLDFVGTDSEYRASQRYSDDREFFRTELADVEPALFARKAPSGARRTARHDVTITRDVLDRIRAIGCSPFEFFAAGFAVYLSRVHSAADVVVGIPLLNRRDQVERRISGEFANTLPLRLSIDEHRSMRDLLAASRSAAKSLKRHERHPLGDVLRELPGTGRQQLFDTTIAYLRWPASVEVAGARCAAGGWAHAQDQDALAIWLYDGYDAEDVLVSFEYAVDVFDADLPIESVARHVLTLLHNALDRIDEPLSDVSMLAPGERDDLVLRRNDTGMPFAADATLPELFAARAAATPDRIAVTDPIEGQVTFAEFEARVNQVAAALRADGVRPDDRVAVVLPRGLDMLIAIHGVLRAGAAYVPVDPGYPAERITFLLADSGAKVALVADDTVAVPDGIVVRPVGDPRAACDPVAPVGTSRDLAYVIYTSGSTGLPKGVAVEHRSVVNRLTWMQRRYPVGDGDVLLQKTPVSFDVSVWELFWWALSGAGVALLPPGAEKDPEEILLTIARCRVTVLHFVPAMLGPFLDLLESRPDLLSAVSSLRLVFCSGEALPADRVNQFNRVFGAGPSLVNLYGPTEATVDVSSFDCPSAPAVVDRVPIGRPIDNIRLYVLDQYGRPAPVGVAGELCIAGVGVARGYLGRPELTREKFRTDPFVPGERMYASGDLARWLADGNLEYLGRIDGQVKIRGNRVEPDEVRGWLAKVPGVREAIVVDRSSTVRGTYLVGYYVADTELDPAWLRGQLAARLPEFMIPAYFLRIDRIPLTRNGKADRRALPAPSDGQATTAVAARTEVEAALAEIWSAVLGLASVGVHDNYFAIGGDSILSLRIRAEAERRGLHFSLADLVGNPTVATLAARVSTSTPSAAEAQLTPFAMLSPTDRARLAGTGGQYDDAFPVTRFSLGILYYSQQNEITDVYHDVFRYTLVTEWDEAALRVAFDRLVARHPVLRSAFDLTSCSEPVQVVHSRIDDGLDVVDLRDLPAEQAEAEVCAHIEERRFHDYRASRPPLYWFRAHVRGSERPGKSTVDLVFSFHHAILDGWSMATLLADLLRGYRQQLDGGATTTSSDPLPSFGNYVWAERKAMTDDVTRRYWARLLRGARVTTWPESPDGTGDDSIVRFVELPAELVAATRGLAKTQGLPLKSALFSAYCQTLRLFADADDVVTGLISNGRPEQADADRVAGLFLNTMPIRLAGAQASWLELVRHVFRQELDSLPHRRYPLSAIQADRGGDVVLTTAFNHVYPHVLAEALRATGVELIDIGVFERTNLALLVQTFVSPRDERIFLRVDADRAHVTEAQADWLVNCYVGVLRQIAERSGHPVARPPSVPAPPAVAPARAAAVERETAAAPERTQGRSAPQDDIERELVAIWTEVLELDSIGVEDNHFERVGGSLNALVIVLNVEERYQVSIPLSAFMADPTIAGLARRLRDGEFATKRDAA